MRRPTRTGREEQLAYVPGETDLLAISVHEVWPGHFLQFLHANRAPNRVGRCFATYAFAEGWAHYTEEMMREAGLGSGDPEVAHRAASNALLRNVRYLSAIGLHAEGMSVRQVEAMFGEKAFQDFGNASQQANRGTYDPGYLNYTLGKLMIRKLRDDWTAQPRRPRGVEGIPRRVPELRFAADPARAPGDARKRYAGALAPARLQHRVDRQPRPQTTRGRASRVQA